MPGSPDYCCPASDRACHVRRRFPVHPQVRRTRWNSYGKAQPAGEQTDAAGHYAAHEATDILVADISEFFANLA